MAEIFNKIKRWRHLLSPDSPLIEKEKKALRERLQKSTLIANIMAYFKINNPIRSNFDWDSIAKKLKGYQSEQWRLIRSKTRFLSNDERAGYETRRIGFLGWKVNCQITVSKHCNKPETVNYRYRNTCLGCHRAHKNFIPCLKNVNAYRKGATKG